MPDGVVAVVVLVLVIKVLAFVEVAALVEVAAFDEETGALPPPPRRVPVKVLLIGPVLMLEYTTYAFGELASTSVGAPDVALQAPRLTPAAVVAFVAGYGASSQSMLAVWSSQIDITRTIPVFIAVPILARPPLRANSLVSPNVVF